MLKKSSLFVALCHLSILRWAALSFSVMPNTFWQKRDKRSSCDSRILSMERSESDDSSITKDEEETQTNPPSSWIDILDPQFRLEIEDELVAKYMKTGLDKMEAQNQKDVFLSDREQAEKYFEMRLYTEANAQSLPTTILQLLGGFLLGFAAIVGPKLLDK